MIDTWEDEFRSTGLAKTIHTEGAIEMLNRILGSLETTRYENGKLLSDQGGDISIMKEVDRIVLEAIRYWTR